jgi:hypothetical protein
MNYGRNGVLEDVQVMTLDTSSFERNGASFLADKLRVHHGASIGMTCRP